MLLSLPGPTLRHVLQKIHNLAHSVDNINLQFHETKLYSRLLVLNIFSLPDTRQESAGSVAPSPEQTMFRTEPLRLTAEASPTSLTPFSRYTLTLFQPFECCGRRRLTEIDHLGLVRGSEGVGPKDDWVAIYGRKFNEELGFSTLLH